MGGGVPDEAVFAKYIQELESKLAVYDQILSKQKYVAGNVHLSPDTHSTFVS